MNERRNHFIELVWRSACVRGVHLASLQKSRSCCAYQLGTYSRRVLLLTFEGSQSHSLIFVETFSTQCRVTSKVSKPISAR